MAKRPRSEIQSVLIHVKGEENGVWIPKKFDINSWITLSAPKQWAKQGNFLAQVKKFKFKPNSTVLQSILVTHAYTHQHLECKSKSQHGAPSNRLNYIYPTNCEDWQDPNSILDVLVVLHAMIGEATRGCRTHKELLECGILFYDSSYVPPTKKGKLGRLAIIPLPPLDDPSWPIPDMSSSELFQARLFLDFHAAMRTSTGGCICRISSFMPFHIMEDLFSGPGSAGMHQTKTLYVFKPVSEALLASLMDEGWDVKREASSDVIKCHVLRPSITFRYHVGRQMLYTTFGYVRERLMKGAWVPMDQVDVVETRSLKIEILDGTHVTLDAGQTWRIRDLREEVGFYMDSEVSFNRWAFGINSATNPTRWEKINPRKEKTMTVEEIGEEKWLSIRAT